MDNGEINARSPLQMTVVRAASEATLLSIGTDQSGLIGLIRHLHGLGFVLLSVNRVETKGALADQRQKS